MDRIEIRGLRVHGHHGVYERERVEGQPFVVDLLLERDLAGAARSDDLADTVDYAALAQRVGDAISTSRFDLIEALAEHLAGLALDESGVVAVTVRVAKPAAPMPVAVDEVAVVVSRTREGGARPASATP